MASTHIHTVINCHQAAVQHTRHAVQYSELYTAWRIHTRETRHAGLPSQVAQSPHTQVCNANGLAQQRHKVYTRQHVQQHCCSFSTKHMLSCTTDGQVKRVTLSFKKACKGKMQGSQHTYPARTLQGRNAQNSAARPNLPMLQCSLTTAARCLLQV
jgi:hypothetical protein